MIRKLAAFVALVALGYLGLDLAIGEDRLLPEQRPAEAKGNPRERALGDGVLVGGERDEGMRKGMRVRVEGELVFHSYKEVPLPDGGVRRLRRYTIRAADSRPLEGGGAQRLEDVTVTFFAHQGELEDVRAVPTGTLTAASAIVEVGVDEKGRRSIHEDKEIDLRDVVLRTNQHARVRDLDLRVGQVLMLRTPQALHLHTRDPEEPFTLVVRDRGTLEMSGRGLEAVIGQVGSGEGEEGGTQMDVLVNHEPEIVHVHDGRSTSIRAAGELRFFEDRATGRAEIRMRRRVVVRGTLVGESAAASRTEARGDELVAWLLRSGNRAVWELVRLEGAPARLAAPRDGLELTCKTILVLPGAGGGPFSITALGEPRLRASSGEGSHVDLRSPTRLHLLRPAEQLDRALDVFGGQARRRLPELLIAEGVATASSGEARLRAAGGILLARLPGRASMALVGRGAGEVRYEGLLARTSGGLRFARGTFGERLELGVESTDAAFEIDRSGGSETIHLAGHGACVLVSRADRSHTSVSITSPRGDLGLRRSGEQAELTDADSLRVKLVGDQRRLEDFEASGTPCRLRTELAEGRVVAEAGAISSPDVDVWILRGDPAIVRHPRGELRAHAIRVVPAGRRAMLRATGRAALRADPGRSERTDAEIRVTADLVEVVPFTAPAEGLEPFLRFLPPASEAAARGVLARGYLLARSEVVVDASAGREISGHGENLVMDDRGAGGILRGGPAVLVEQEEGQRLEGRATAIRFRRGPHGEILHLVADPEHTPSILVEGARGSFARLGSGPQRVLLRSRDSIDVSPEAISLTGDVEVVSLDTSGAPDPGGLSLRAARLRMQRDRRSGEVSVVRASGDARLRFSGLEARSGSLSLDLVHHSCMAADPAGAVIRLPHGVVYRGPRVEVDYVTLEWLAWNGRVENSADR